MGRQSITEVFITWQGEAGERRRRIQSLLQHQHTNIIVELVVPAEVGVVEGVGCPGAAPPETHVKRKLVRHGVAGEGEGNGYCGVMRK